jgi:hypothetical protein
MKLFSGVLSAVSKRCGGVALGCARSKFNFHRGCGLCWIVPCRNGGLGATEKVSFNVRQKIKNIRPNSNHLPALITSPRKIADQCQRRKRRNRQPQVLTTLEESSSSGLVSIWSADYPSNSGAAVTAGSGAELVDICLSQRIPDRLNDESASGQFGQSATAFVIWSEPPSANIFTWCTSRNGEPSSL